MTDYMTPDEFHEYQATGKLPKRHRQQTRSSVLAQIADRDPQLATKAAKRTPSQVEIDNPGPDLAILEKEFQQLVEQAARAASWLVYHTYSSRRSEPGFPDLVLVNPARKRTVFAELKTQSGSVSEYQLRWLAALGDAGQEVYLWRPSDWNAIHAVLTGKQIEP